ncbi:hypothetical protein L1887_30350 [Cichorium endivia]|nr:hypothetical protein L1887_30350 [Cichorium endivia]
MVRWGKGEEIDGENGLNTCKLIYPSLPSLQIFYNGNMDFGYLQNMDYGYSENGFWILGLLIPFTIFRSNRYAIFGNE